MITLQDLIDHFGQKEIAELTDRENYEVIDEVVVNKAIRAATAEVAPYLRAAGLVITNAQGETVYINATKSPDDLILKTCDIARYFLYENGTIDIVKERYDNAVTWLKLVMKNPTMLTGPESAVAANEQSAHVITNIVPDYWRD